MPASVWEYAIGGGVSLLNGGLFESVGYELPDSSAVRPVVILKSDVTVNDVHKIADQQEEEWQLPGEH